jgi:hypothetical protein
MVIFGAGASFDSSASHPAASGSRWDDIHRAERLPLADSLLEERRAFARIAGRLKELTPIIPYLRELANELDSLYLEGLTDMRAEQLVIMTATRFL